MLKRRANIAVLVSGGGTNLQALINAEKSGMLHSGKIRLVVANKPDAYALVRAKEAGIAVAVADKKELGHRGMEERILALLSESDIDLIVLAGFMCILSADFTRRFERRMINIHPSLIPAFCGEGFYGLRVHEAALARGVRVTGATVHFVNDIPDGGEIIMQKAVSVRKNDTPHTLQKRVMRLAEWKILPEATERICAQLLTEKEGDRE